MLYFYLSNLSVGLTALPIRQNLGCLAISESPPFKSAFANAPVFADASAGKRRINPPNGMAGKIGFVWVCFDQVSIVDFLL